MAAALPKVAFIGTFGPPGCEVEPDWSTGGARPVCDCSARAIGTHRYRRGWGRLEIFAEYGKGLA